MRSLLYVIRSYYYHRATDEVNLAQNDGDCIVVKLKSVGINENSSEMRRKAGVTKIVDFKQADKSNHL